MTYQDDWDKKVGNVIHVVIVIAAVLFLGAWALAACDDSDDCRRHGGRPIIVEWRTFCIQKDGTVVKR